MRGRSRSPRGAGGSEHSGGRLSFRPTSLGPVAPEDEDLLGDRAPVANGASAGRVAGGMEPGRGGGGLNWRIAGSASRAEHDAGIRAKIFCRRNTNSPERVESTSDGEVVAGRGGTKNVVPEAAVENVVVSREDGLQAKVVVPSTSQEDGPRGPGDDNFAKAKEEASGGDVGPVPAAVGDRESSARGAPDKPFILVDIEDSVVGGRGGRGPPPPIEAPTLDLGPNLFGVKRPRILRRSYTSIPAPEHHDFVRPPSTPEFGHASSTSAAATDSLNSRRASSPPALLNTDTGAAAGNDDAPQKDGIAKAQPADMKTKRPSVAAVRPKRKVAGMRSATTAPDLADARPRSKSMSARSETMGAIPARPTKAPRSKSISGEGAGLLSGTPEPKSGLKRGSVPAKKQARVRF